MVTSSDGLLADLGAGLVPKEVEHTVRLPLLADLPREGEGGVPAGDDAALVEVRDVDLDAGVILAADDAVGPGAARQAGGGGKSVPESGQCGDWARFYALSQRKVRELRPPPGLPSPSTSAAVGSTTVLGRLHDGTEMVGGSPEPRPPPHFAPSAG